MADPRGSLTSAFAAYDPQRAIPLRKPTNEDYWRQQLANQGAISAPERSLGGLLASALTAGAKKAGAGDRYARHVADRATAALTDLTPVGNAVGVEDGGKQFGLGVKHGDLAQAAIGAGVFGLSMLPFANGAKKPLSALLRDEAGSMGRGMGGVDVFHGGPVLIDNFDPSKTVDGGFHFGTEAQARMRAGRQGVLTPAQIDLRRPRRSKDMGGNWASKIASAKSAGHDGIVYLNRYEGLTTDIIERLNAQGVLHKLDDMSDAEFRKWVPEAQDSFIAFDPAQITRKR